MGAKGLSAQIMSDQIMSDKVRPARGTCSSYNVVYLFICSICNKPYTGRTVNKMNNRTSIDRGGFKKLLKLKRNNTDLSKITEFNNDDDDIYSLGFHLISEHGCVNESDFNKFYKFLILENSSPQNIDVREHMWIHNLRSLRPLGIYRCNPFSLPLLCTDNVT